MKVLFFDCCGALLCSGVKETGLSISGHVINGYWHMYFRKDRGMLYAFNAGVPRGQAVRAMQAAVTGVVDVPHGLWKRPVCRETTTFEDEARAYGDWYNGIISWAEQQLTHPDYVI